MVRSNPAKELMKLVDELQAERAQHAAAIEEIDRTFASLGITASSSAPKPGKKRGRPAGSKNKTTKSAGGDQSRKRGSFGKTGEETVIEFVKANANCTTADVNNYWKAEGRKGSADNALTKLVKEKKIKRKNIPGQRGSQFKA